MPARSRTQLDFPGAASELALRLSPLTLLYAKPEPGLGNPPEGAFSGMWGPGASCGTPSAARAGTLLAAPSSPQRAEGALGAPHLGVVPGLRLQMCSPGSIPEHPRVRGSEDVFIAPQPGSE